MFRVAHIRQVRMKDESEIALRSGHTAEKTARRLSADRRRVNSNHGRVSFRELRRALIRRRVPLDPAEIVKYFYEVDLPDRRKAAQRARDPIPTLLRMIVSKLPGGICVKG